MGWKDRIQSDLTPTKTSSWRDRIVQEPEVQEEPSLLSQVGQAFANTAEVIPVAAAKGITVGGLEELTGGIVGGVEKARSELAKYIPALESPEEEVNRQLREKGFTGDLPTAGEKSLVKQYQEARDAAKQYTGKLAEENPIQFLGSEVAGGLPLFAATGGTSAIVPTAKGGEMIIGAAKSAEKIVPKLSQGVTELAKDYPGISRILEQIGVGATQGAGYGAITGLTEGKGDLTKGEVGQVLEDIKEGATTGAKWGGGISGVASAIPVGVKNISDAGFNQLEKMRNTNPTIDKILRIKEASTEGSYKEGGKELLEQGKAQKFNVEDVLDLQDKAQAAFGKPMGDIVKKVEKGQDVTNDLLKIKQKVDSGEFKSLGEESKEEVRNSIAELEKLIMVPKVTKSGAEIAKEEAILKQKQLLDDFQAKKFELENANLTTKEVDKALEKAQLKKLRLEEDLAKKADIKNQPFVPSLSEGIEQLPQSKRQAFYDTNSGKTYSTPIKDVKELDTPQFSSPEIQQDLKRVVFRDQKGETYTTPIGQDIIENVVGQKILTGPELQTAKSEFGKLARSAKTPEGRKITNEIENVFRQHIVKGLDPKSADEYLKLANNYRELMDAFNTVKQGIGSMKDGPEKDKIIRQFANKVNMSGDPRNLVARLEVDDFFRKLEKVLPEDARMMEDKMLKLAKDIDTNQMILGIDPSMSSQLTRIFGSAVQWAARGAKKIGEIERPDMNKNISKVLKGQELAAKTSPEILLEKANKYRNQGNDSVANFYENLSKASENRKKALLFVASQNPNLKDELFGEDEEETP